MDNAQELVILTNTQEQLDATSQTLHSQTTLTPQTTEATTIIQLDSSQTMSNIVNIDPSSILNNTQETATINQQLPSVMEMGQNEQILLEQPAMSYQLDGKTNMILNPSLSDPLQYKMKLGDYEVPLEEQSEKVVVESLSDRVVTGLDMNQMVQIETAPGGFTNSTLKEFQQAMSEGKPFMLMCKQDE